jgi:hypothetical protein
MKKILIKLVIFLLVFSSMTIAAFHDEEHIHEIEADTVVCPNCGRTGLSIVAKVRDATCTSPAVYHAVCGYCEFDGQVSGTDVLGHDYRLISSAEATCTEGGYKSYTCNRCGESYTENIAALGHNYKSKVTKEATCEEDGVRTYTCSRCNKSYTKTIEALGHDIEYEEKEATCTEDGYKKGTCKRCGMVVDDIYPALGHDLEYTILKAPTCEEEGEREALCKRCGESWKEKILPAGHKYPKEWTLEKEPSYLEEGLETKTCYYCGHVLSHVLARKDPTPIIAIGGAGIAVVLGGLWIYLRKRKAAQLLKEAAKKVKEFEKPSIEDKSILVASKDEDLVNVLKSKKHLVISTCDNGEIEEKVEEDSPDLVIMDVLSEERYDELLKQKKEALSEQNIAVVTTDEFIKEHKRKLNNRIKDKTIINYLPYGSEKNEILMKFVLPILKPDIKSDESLSNIGAVADFLGIPGISEIINVYVSGRDIKSTLESEEIGVSETATIIGDIASILGLDTVASVAGLVDDIDSIKGAVDKEAGAHEHSAGVSGAKDIVEVVSDLVDKD